MSEIAKLLERVKGLTGPDRRIDGDIAEMLGEVPEAYANRSFRQPELWSDNGHGLHARTWLAPKYTASIDAALALTERVLPGWVVTDLSQNAYLAGDPWGCALAYYNGGDPSKNRAAESGYDFPKAPLAILVATLSALQDQRHDQ